MCAVGLLRAPLSKERTGACKLGRSNGDEREGVSNRFGLTRRAGLRVRFVLLLHSSSARVDRAR